jgi:hypothetical protein
MTYLEICIDLGGGTLKKCQIQILGFEKTTFTPLPLPNFPSNFLIFSLKISLIVLALAEDIKLVIKLGNSSTSSKM